MPHGTLCLTRARLTSTWLSLAEFLARLLAMELLGMQTTSWSCRASPMFPIHQAKPITEALVRAAKISIENGREGVAVWAMQGVDMAGFLSQRETAEGGPA